MAIFSGETLGALLTLLGFDGTEFRNLKVDADGHLQIDALALALPSGAATETTLATLATDAKLELVRLLLVSLAAEDFATQTTLALLLTELQAKADLDETQPVSAASLPLPSGAATETTLATLATDAKLELVRLLLVSLDGKDFATDTALGSLLTELQLKADLTETQPVSAAALPLPSGAATAANQALMVTALQLIDDLRGALHSVSTDALLVRGEDQLDSFKTKLLDATENLDTGAGAIGLAGSTVPAGEVWVVTTVLAINTVTVCTGIYLYVIDGSDEAAFRRGDTPSITAGLSWSGHVYLEAGDRVNATFVDCVLHDLVYLQTLGYKMLKATNGGPPPGGAQDLTTFIEVDPEPNLTVTPTMITASDLDCFWEVGVYKDFGADYFDALNIDFDIQILNTSTADGGCYVSLTNTIGDYTDFGSTDVSLNIIEGSGEAKYLFLKRGYNLASDGYAASGDTWYYCTFVRAAGQDTVSLKIYSNAARTTLLDTLTLAGFGTVKWQYLYAIVNRDLDEGHYHFDGYVGNLAIG